jgi:hypothetical protein
MIVAWAAKWKLTVGDPKSSDLGAMKIMAASSTIENPLILG